MYLNGSLISCGIRELEGVGKNPTKGAYINAMRNRLAYDSARFVIASVPSKWTKSCNFLKSVGFKQTGIGKNPNSGNEIILFTKKLTNKEIKQFLNRSLR